MLFVCFFSHALGQMFNDETGVGRDLIFFVKVAHETNGVPMVVVECEVFFFSQHLGYILVPVAGVNQITFCVAFGHVGAHAGNLL